MPEDVKLSSYVPAKDCKSDYCSPADDSHPESSIYADHSDREMSRSETSSCSDESSCYKQNGHEMIEIIPTRTIKTLIPKPAANPLQFVKIGPCDLYRSAQKQIQKVSEVKTPKKEVKDEVAMDWQSNLDSWKCNRRKQQEHIIERVVEVKKLELEEHDRNRKRTKTFSEMMEERTSKGRKTSLPVYLEDDNDDLSELGLSSNKCENESSLILEENDEEDDEDSTFVQRKYDEQEPSSRPKARSFIPNNKKTNSTESRKYGRRASATKIEEKLSELERIKNRSVSSSDLTDSNKKPIVVPKVNIFERKEMFEKFSDSGEMNKTKRLNDEIPPVPSIKERLSSLGRTIDETSTATKTTAVVTKPKSLLPMPEVSVRERLSSINKRMNEHSVCTRVPEKIENRLKRSTDTENSGKSKEYVPFETRPLCKPVEELSRREYNSSGRSSSSEDYDHVHQTHHFHHRSLDSLQGHDSPNGFCFERVQSLEFINCCSNYPASVLSGDTDREDSGIHTADVSSSVSQADDFDLHADTSMDVDVKTQNVVTLINDDTKVDKSSQSDYCFVSQERQQSSLDNLHEHVDAIMRCENSSTEEQTQEKELSTVVPNQKLDIVEIESDEILTENQNSIQQLNEENTRQLFNGNNCDSNNMESPVKKEDCWRESYDNAADRDELVNQTVKENLFEEKISTALNTELFDVSERVDRNLVNVADECSPTTGTDDIKQTRSTNFDYICGTNSELEEVNLVDFSHSNQLFAFEPSSVIAEPPKEKPPPPPPAEGTDEELGEMDSSKNLRRMDSTKRIKKQLRQKRSSFLGIESYDDDCYLEPELEAVKPPPDMITFLQEERRLEKMLFRQSICSESDSIFGESRDSGVELDKNHNEESSWVPQKSNTIHNDEVYPNTNALSEEDEIIKKEREILEILEMEERRNYESETKNECDFIGKNLVLKLKELESQENDVFWDEENERSYEIENKSIVVPDCRNYDEQILEQKRHQLHELARQPAADSVLLQQQWAGRSLQDLSENTIPISTVDENPLKTRLDYRNSMPNIQHESRTASIDQQHEQPPPVPNNKPTYFQELSTTNKNSNPQQMSKQTLQALSAVPRSKITDSWVQTKKKPRQEAYNYQHWLIQEAEHRRITEYQQRQAKENSVHNYVNIQPEFLEPAGLTTDATQHQRQPSPPNRVSTYSHPSQMLPYQNQNQSFNNKSKCKSQTKVQSNNNVSSVTNNSNSKPLPDSVIQTLTQRVQNRLGINDSTKQKRQRETHSNSLKQQEKMLSVSGKKKCSHCGEELGRGAAMIIESLRLFYHIDCFRCCVCCVQLGDGLMGTDVRVRNSKLHCHSCYSNDEGLKFSCV